MEIVSDFDQLQRAAEHLSGAPTYYIDTEFESSKQGKRLSLIQISCGETIYIVDALTIPNLAPLGEVTCRADAEWVLHAGLQDVELLMQSFGKRPIPMLFDTQVVWGLLGPEASVSLSFLQFRVLGIRASKGYQADDWIRRPLPPAQLEYAAQDIEHLPALAQTLRERAVKSGRDPIIHPACRELLFPQSQPATPLKFESFRNAWQLDGRGQLALRKLISWHNELPAHQATLQPRTLLAISGRLPESRGDLGRIKGVSPGVLRRHGATIVSRLDEVRNQPVDESLLEPPAYASFEQNLREARLLLIRAELCSRLSIAPEIALPMALVRRMMTRAEEAQTVVAGADELSGWRRPLLAAGFRVRAAELEASVG